MLVVVGIAIIVIAVILLSFNSYKLSSIPRENLLAESSAATSQKAMGEVVEFKINLSLLDTRSTLAPPTSCAGAAALKAYPQMPKKWAEQTKCGQAYMKNTIYRHQRDMAQAGVDWLNDNITMVRKSLKEILPLTDIKDLPSGGMIPTGEIEGLPLEGANLSIQCVKNELGQVTGAAVLAGEYREDFAKAEAYLPFSEATLKKLMKFYADPSFIAGMLLAPKYTLISNNSFAGRSEPGMFQPASISRNESEDIKIPLTGGTLCKGYDIDTPLGFDTVCLPFDPLSRIKAQTKNRLETMTSMQSSLRSNVARYKSAITALERANPSCFGLSGEK